MKFSEFNFQDSLQEGISSMGYENATPIQELAIPIVLSGRDIIGCAQTGTGKTAAFLLPVIEYILKNKTKGKGVAALVIVPTRELAIQIDQQVEGLGYFTGVGSMAIYGGGDGSSFEQEKQALSGGAEIIIATPGRLISHLNMGYVKFDTAQFLILDEADRMLDMGFYEDLVKIVNHMPEKRNNLLFSATMPPKIRKLANTILNNPEEVNIAISKPAAGVVQGAFMVYDSQKIGLIAHLLTAKEMESVIVFCSTKKDVTLVTAALKHKKLSVEGISSDLDQAEREKILREYKNKQVKVLVATNIMARGIDIDSIELVINYDVPRDAEEYVHRVGRTARANTQGIAFTLITEKDQYEFGQIEQLIETEVRKLPVPAILGETPTYSPKTPSKGGKGKRFVKKRK
ncbi:MAG: DEAD/DEAH box helicase [Cyclobacteriaceae bacterium]|nr:DEAD/DEAH box helicase [Cyclobacteriaceae bacterium]